MNKIKLHNISSMTAFEMIQSNSRTIFIDIRSSMEFLFVGHPVGVIHLPWIDEPDWEINPNFVTEVRKLILGGVSSATEEGSVPVILICRSGKRSANAGDVLLTAGLKNIYHIDEGFEGELNDGHKRSSVGGWRYHGLPWEQC